MVLTLYAILDLHTIGSVLAQNDVTGPTVQSLSVSPTTVNAGGQVTVTAKITDAESGVGSSNYVFAYYQLPNGQGAPTNANFQRTSGTDADGTWQAAMQIPVTSPSGTWTINSMYVRDNAGNTTSITPPTPPTPNGAFTVVGGSSDQTGPTVQALSVSPTTVNAGGHVTITARITDAESGVGPNNYVFAYYALPTGQTGPTSASFQRTSGTDADGTWQATMQIPTASASGTWTINSMYARDNAGNTTSITPPTPPTPNGAFTVVGNNSDLTGPTVQSLSVSPTTVNAGGQVTVTARITDAETGVGPNNYVFAYYALPNGQTAPVGATFQRASGTDADGTWQATMQIPAASASGTWTINVMHVRDDAGNTTSITPPTPPTPNGAFTVVGASDNTDPTLVSLSASPTTVNAGSSVTLTARVTDAGTGVTSVSGCFTLPSGDLAFGGSCLSFTRTAGTAQDGTWQLTFTVPAASGSGPWHPYISARDVAGNQMDVQHPTPPTPDGVFSVVGTDDNADPTLQSLSASSATVNAGNTITLTARVTDAGTGVTSVSGCFTLPNGDLAFGGSCLSFTRTTGTAQDGTWQLTFTVPATSGSGQWHPDISARDAAGNQMDVQYPTSPTPDGVFTVVGSDDNTDPTLVSLNVSPTTVNAGNNVTLTARVTDAGSGVASVSGCFTLPSGDLAFGGSCLSFTRTSGTMQDGTWQLTFTVPAASGSGPWHPLISARDAAGNQMDVHYPTPPTPDGVFTVAGAQRTLTVTKIGSGIGTVSGSGINCGSTCTGQVSQGSPVTLTAQPAQGANVSTFTGWGGACAPAGKNTTCSLTVSGDTSVTATFERVNAGVSVGPLPVLLPNGDRQLGATLTARAGCGAIDHIQFGDPGRSFSNALVAIASPLGGPPPQTTGFTYTPPSGTTSVSITIQRVAQSGGATVSPIRLYDGCGEWRTFVGGGPNAFH